jgi:hypothetical protein
VCDQGSRSSQDNCALICADPRSVVLNASSEVVNVSSSTLLLTAFDDPG